MECGSLPPPAAWSLGVISILQVSASVGIVVRAAILDSPTGRAGASRRFAAGLFPPGSSTVAENTLTTSHDKFLHAVLVSNQSEGGIATKALTLKSERELVSAHFWACRDDGSQRQPA